MSEWPPELERRLGEHESRIEELERRHTHADGELKLFISEVRDEFTSHRRSHESQALSSEQLRVDVGIIKGLAEGDKQRREQRHDRVKVWLIGIPVFGGALAWAFEHWGGK